VDLKKNHLSKQTKLQIEEEKYKPPTNRRLFNESNKCPNLYLQQASRFFFLQESSTYLGMFSAQIYVCQLPVLPIIFQHYVSHKLIYFTLFHTNYKKGEYSNTQTFVLDMVI